MPTLGEQIKAARKEKRLSLQQLAQQLGVTVAAVSQWETGASNPSNKNRAKLSSMLNISAQEMLGVYSELPATVVRDVGSNIRPIDFTGDAVPVFWHRVGEDGVLHIEKRPVNLVPRTDYLRFSQYAFGLEVMHDSMSPAYERRDIAIMNPDRPVVAGDDVLIVRGFEAKSEDPFEAVLCRLLNETATHWVCRQYNPARDFKLAKETWPRALHVAGKRSR